MQLYVVSHEILVAYNLTVTKYYNKIFEQVFSLATMTASTDTYHRHMMICLTMEWTLKSGVTGPDNPQ